MMSAMSEAIAHRRTTGVRTVAVVAAAVASLSACGSGEPSADAATTSAPETTVPVTTTIAPTTTVAETAETLPDLVTTTVATSTTAAETTTTLAAQASEPIAPPQDEYATEPVIELGTIAIPEIDVEMTMYEGIRLTTLDYGPGHWPGSAMPGEVGNVVVAGHRTSNHQVFRNIDQLEPGDEIVFTDERGVHVYAVSHTEIIEPTEVWIVDPTPTATVTLFACHPPGSTRQRIAVFGDLVSG